MTVLRISNLSISFQGNPVLRNINATLSAGSRTGIVGPNGCGKTTLLKAIVGSAGRDMHLREASYPDSGTIDWVRRTRVGYVPQVFSYDMTKTPVDIIGYEKTAFLGQCGIGKDLWDKPARELSGGQRTRLALACAFSEIPELLILDEPTNHLDIEGIEWLEKLILGFSGTVLVVSHDRFFMDVVCTDIWEIRDGSLRQYSGNYSSYLEQRRNEEAHAAKEHEKWVTEVKSLRAEVRDRRQWFEKAHKDAGQNDFYRRKAKKHSRQFKAKESALKRLIENEPEKPLKTRTITVEISHRAYRTETVARAKDLMFGYGSSGCGDEEVLLRKVSFSLKPGQKVGLIGQNGCGKTTLLKLLIGELVPLSGQIWVNPGVKIGYLSQMLENLNLEKSATENVCASTGLLRAEARNLLGKLGISDESQLQPMATMSMGERSRVALACMTFGRFDLLLLDEPTNHLDSVARDAVEASLASFAGAIVMATHDRYLLDKVCDTIWHLENGLITVHNGNYTAYKNFQAAFRIEPADRDAKAYELALKTRLAYIASQISLTRDEGQKADLDRQYHDVLAQLRAKTKG